MKNLCSGTQCGGFQFLLILDVWGLKFYAAVVFGLGKHFLFKSTLGHCENLHMIDISSISHLPRLVKVFKERTFRATKKASG